MNEGIDHGARERIKDLEVLTREIGSALWGDDVRRDNGLRSEVREYGRKIAELEEFKRTTETTWQHYIDFERANTCVGLAALAKAEEGIDSAEYETDEEDTEVQIAEINAKAMLEAAQRNYKATLWGQVLTTAGLIFVAVLQLSK